MSTNEAIGQNDGPVDGRADGIAQWIPEWFPDRNTHESQPANSERPRTIYAVVMHDDEVHACRDFVEILEQVFGYSEPAAYVLTQDIAKAGRAVVWKGFRKDAEQKADQARNYQPRWRLGGSVTSPQREVQAVSPCTITVELAQHAAELEVPS